MSGSNDLKKVKERIKALLNMTVDRGASESEANTAMNKVGVLLQQYNIALEEIDVAFETCMLKSVPSGSPKHSLHNIYISCLAALCNVRCWYNRPAGKGEVFYNFFGFEPDVMMAEYLFDITNRSIRFETNRYKSSAEYMFATVHRKRLSNSFQNAMALRLKERLWEMTLQNRAAVQANASSTTSSSTSLVVVAKSKRIEAEFAKFGMKLRTSKPSHRITERGGFNAGYKAGDNVNLRRPIEEDEVKLIG